jgi:hypothetical protein
MGIALGRGVAGASEFAREKRFIKLAESQVATQLIPNDVGMPTWQRLLLGFDVVG